MGLAPLLVLAGPAGVCDTCDAFAYLSRYGNELLFLKHRLLAKGLEKE
jgi:hypothetical protein